LSDPKSGQTSWLLRLVFGIVLLFLITIPFVVAELYLRSIGAGDPILYYTNSSYRYAPKPNQKHIGQRGARIAIDSMGLRGVKEWTAPADKKILFIGASATWGGTYVDDKDLYSNIVCTRLEKTLHRSFTCGNAGVNSYGVDNMAERIRYKDFSDESAIVVTVAPFNTVRGLNDLDTTPYFSLAPPGPFKALWEAATLWVWQLQHRRPVPYDRSHDLRVAERSLDNLFAALRETDRPDRKVLIVLIPMRDQLNGREDQLNGETRPRRPARLEIRCSGSEPADFRDGESRCVILFGRRPSGACWPSTGRRADCRQAAKLLCQALKSRSGRIPGSPGELGLKVGPDQNNV
jgi:hypothetical protein